MTVIADEIAAEVVARWTELSSIPLGYVGQVGEQANSRSRDSDALELIAPPDYFEALCDVEVPRHGMVRCPLPEHEDRTPSCRVYPDSERGWFCFGCCRGGTIYDLAAHLWGVPTRGPEFVELRREIARMLLWSES